MKTAHQTVRTPIDSLDAANKDFAEDVFNLANSGKTGDPNGFAEAQFVNAPVGTIFIDEGGGVGEEVAYQKLLSGVWGFPQVSSNVVPKNDLTLSICEASKRFLSVRTKELFVHNAIPGQGTATISPSAGALIADFGTDYQSYQSVLVQGRGSIAGGRVLRAAGTPGTGTAQMRVGAYGSASFAWGLAGAKGNDDGLLECALPGAVAIGGAYAFGAPAALRSTYRGSISHGYVYGTAVGGTANIISGGNGSWAGGYCAGGTIQAKGSGSFAWGMTYGSARRIYANGYANVAMGYTDTGDIEATGYANCIQFGPGTNSQRDSMQIGNAGIRFKGTTGAPAVLQDGDRWVSGGFNYIRDNGATYKIVGSLPAEVQTRLITGTESIGNGTKTLRLHTNAVGAVFGVIAADNYGPYTDDVAELGVQSYVAGGIADVDFNPGVCMGTAYAYGGQTLSRVLNRGLGGAILGAYCQASYCYGGGSDILFGRTPGSGTPFSIGGITSGRTLAGGFGYQADAKILNYASDAGFICAHVRTFSRAAGPALKHTAELTTAVSGSMLFGSIDSSLTSNQILDSLLSCQTSGSFVGGLISANQGGTIKVDTGGGSMAHGFVQRQGTIRSYGVGSFARGNADSGTIYAGGSGSMASGLVADTDPTSQIKASGPGAHAFGYAKTGGAVIARGKGALAVGSAYDTGSDIDAVSDGSLAGGFIKGGGFIQSGDKGSMAFGYSKAGGGMGTSYPGAFALGHVDGAGSYISSSAKGAFALGFAIGGNDITARGPGALAFGDATSGTIDASVSNAWQFGPGANAQVNSMSIGTGPRFKGTTGAPLVLRDGDQWVNSGYVYIRSNGVSVKIT